MADIERNASRMREADLTVVPIVVNAADDVRREITRFGLKTPFLIDEDKSVSEMYGVLGTGHHADLPGHGFALVDGEGRLVWQKNYPVMFVKTEELLADMGRAG
jgi:peroxiredoxin